MRLFRRPRRPARLHTRLIRFVCLFVPRRLRDDWRREWEAELSHREGVLARWNRLDRSGRLELLRRSAGACWDALWLQPRRLQDDLVQDVHYGARMLLRSPVFTLTAVLALTLGIGANITTFSVVDAAILRSLPFAGAERLVGFWHPLPNNQFLTGIRYEALQEWRKQTGLFEQIEASTSKTLLLTGVSDPEHLSAPAITPGTFAMLRVQPRIGRSFLAGESVPGHDLVTVISDEMWKKHFGADPKVLGRSITLSRRSYTVVGVMPPGFKYPISGGKHPQLWVPLALDAREAGKTVIAVGRLRPGVSIKTAEDRLNALAVRLDGARPDPEGIGWKAKVFRPDEMYFKEQWRPRLLALFAAGGFVLLLACMNVANLLLSRSASRRRELAIRGALGASRLRLIRQMMTESIALALLGAAGGLLVGWWGIRALNLISPDTVRNMSIFGEVAVNARVLGFTAGLAILTSLAFGLGPALKASREEVQESLKGGARGTPPAHFGLRNVLIVSEIALSLVLLVGAGLTIRSFVRLSHEPLGFEPENLLSCSLSLPRYRYATPAAQQDFFDRLAGNLRSLPGQEGVTTSAYLPPDPVEFQVEGQPGQRPSTRFMPEATYVEPNFFNVMRTRVRGRVFTDGDRPDSPPVAIVSERLARRYWPGGDALGKRFRVGPTGGWQTIVGIAANMIGSEAANSMAFYFPMSQASVPLGMRTIRIRTSSAPEGAIPAVKTQVRAIDKDQPIIQVGVFDNVSLQRPRFYSALMAAFAAIALLLAAIGIYGVIAFLVSQRTREIGVRLALGAQRRDVMRLIVGRGLLLTLSGTLLGIAASFALTRFLASLLAGISTTDRLTFALASALLAATALLASYVPATRARRVDPASALRQE